MHVTSSPVDWYAARAAGIAAYLVLTFVVTFGLAMAGKAQSKTWPKFAIEDVHRLGGNSHMVELALLRGAQHRRAFEEVVARERKDAPFGQARDRVARAPDALEQRCDPVRR